MKKSKRIKQLERHQQKILAALMGERHVTKIQRDLIDIAESAIDELEAKLNRQSVHLDKVTAANEELGEYCIELEGSNDRLERYVDFLETRFCNTVTTWEFTMEEE